MSKTYCIIGDGIAGATAAETLRENDPEAEIHVFTDESEPLYNRIMLKSYMNGDIPKKFARMHNEEWYEERKIDLHLETTVDEVETEENQLSTEDGDVYRYDKCLIATGGSPKKLPQDDGYENLHYMWTMESAETIRESAEDADRAVVVGGGLLGIDLAVAYAENGAEVFYVIRGPNWWHRGLEEKGAEIIHRKLEEKGVNILKEQEVAGFETDGDKIEAVELKSGFIIQEIDAVGAAIGQNPNSALIDVEKNDEGMIKTDEYLQTSDPDVYAAGDKVEYYSPVFDKRVSNGSWDHSEAMGEQVAKNMLGDKEKFKFINTYGIGHFDVQFLAIGSNFGKPEIEKHDGDEYRRKFYHGDRLVGAVLIGDVSGQEGIMREIRFI